MKKKFILSLLASFLFCLNASAQNDSLVSAGATAIYDPASDTLLDMETQQPIIDDYVLYNANGLRIDENYRRRLLGNSQTDRKYVCVELGQTCNSDGYCTTWFDCYWQN